MTERLIAFLLQYAGYVGIALIALTLLAWHRFVAALEWPWAIRVRWTDEIARERAQEHARRAQELRVVAFRQREQDARIHRIVRGGGGHAA